MNASKSNEIILVGECSFSRCCNCFRVKIHDPQFNVIPFIVSIATQAPSFSHYRLCRLYNLAALLIIKRGDAELPLSN